MNEQEKKVEESQSTWLLDLIANFIPNDTDITGKSVEQMIKSAARKAAAVSFFAAIPPGPLGWLTLLPELISVTKIQVNLIHKIAKYYNQQNKINPTIIAMVLSNIGNDEKIIKVAKTKVTEEVITKTTRKIVTEGGKKVEVLIIQKLSNEAAKETLRKLSKKIAILLTSKGFARMLILIASVIFGRMSYKSTEQIGRKADEIFSKRIEFADNL